MSQSPLKIFFILGHRAAEGLGHDAGPEGDLQQRVLHHLPHHDVRVRLHVRLRRDLSLRLPQGSIAIIFRFAIHFIFGFLRENCSPSKSFFFNQANVFVLPYKTIASSINDILHSREPMQGRMNFIKENSEDIALSKMSYSFIHPRD